MLTGILQRLRKAGSLGRREWRDLVVAQYALLRAQWRVKRVPIGRLVVKAPARAGQATGDGVRANAVALAVSRAAEYGVFRPLCLVRAIALQDLLRSNGVSGSELRVGVRHEAGAFTAHAWVVWRNQVLGDRAEYVAKFVEVDDLRVLDTP